MGASSKLELGTAGTGRSGTAGGERPGTSGTGRSGTAGTARAGVAGTERSGIAGRSFAMGVFSRGRVPNAFVGNLGRPAGGREGIGRPSVLLAGPCISGRAVTLLPRSVPERAGTLGASAFVSLPLSAPPKVRAGTAGAERRLLSLLMLLPNGSDAGGSVGNDRAGTLGGTAGRGQGLAPKSDVLLKLFVVERLCRSSSGFSHVTSSVLLFQ